MPTNFNCVSPRRMLLQEIHISVWNPLSRESIMRRVEMARSERRRWWNCVTKLHRQRSSGIAFQFDRESRAGRRAEKVNSINGDGLDSRAKTIWWKICSGMNSQSFSNRIQLSEHVIAPEPPAKRNQTNDFQFPEQQQSTLVDRNIRKIDSCDYTKCTKAAECGAQTSERSRRERAQRRSGRATASQIFNSTKYLWAIVKGKYRKPKIARSKPEALAQMYRGTFEWRPISAVRRKNSLRLHPEMPEIREPYRIPPPKRKSFQLK